MEDEQIEVDQTTDGSDEPIATEILKEKPKVLTLFEPCLICGGRTKGLHFQVTACRACAAFYRRTIKSKRIYRCQKGTKNCNLNIKGKGKPLCRYCRMQKCKEIGMRLVEEDLKDEIGSHSASSTSPVTSPITIIPNMSSDLSSLSTNSNAALSPEKIIVPQPHNHQHYTTTPNECVMQSALYPPPPRIEGNRLVYDCNPLIQTIKSILNQPAKSLYLTHGIHLSFMQQLQYSFSQFQSIVLPPPGTIIETVYEFDMDLMKFNETYISSLADMVMRCEHFAQLPLNDKYVMFKRFWPLFQGIERTFATTLLCGTSANDNRFLISDRYAVDFSSKSLSMKGFPQESLDKLKPFNRIIWSGQKWQHMLTVSVLCQNFSGILRTRKFAKYYEKDGISYCIIEFLSYMEPMLEKSTRFLLQPIKSLRITAFEVAYLSAYILWTVHGIPGLSEATLNIADDIFEQSASELHNYYVYEMRLPNYAPRLAKLTKIVSAAEHTVHAKKDFSTMAKVFDIFDCDFCTSELMDL